MKFSLEKGEKRPRVDVWESRGLDLRANQWVKSLKKYFLKYEGRIGVSLLP